MSFVFLEDGPNLAVTLRASESLGGVFDYYGVAGHVTLHHLPSGTRYALEVFELEDETPDVPSDVFQATRLSAGMPMGLYRLEALLVDLAGNRKVFGLEPGIGDRVGSLEFTLLERRTRRWFNPRGKDRTVRFKTQDRSTVYRAKEVS